MFLMHFDIFTLFTLRLCSLAFSLHRVQQYFQSVNFCHKKAVSNVIMMGISVQPNIRQQQLTSGHQPSPSLRYFEARLLSRSSHRHAYQHKIECACVHLQIFHEVSSNPIINTRRKWISHQYLDLKTQLANRPTPNCPLKRQTSR